jgi:putative sterol carrier protein
MFATAQELTMSIDTARQSITEKVGTDSGLDATLRFDCGDAGSIFIDGKAMPNTVSDSIGPADCTIKVTLENLEALIAGELQATTAFMSGKIQVEGDIAIAMRLSRVL